jgi:phenylalanyl-tRNA synthetase beta chain
LEEKRIVVRRALDSEDLTTLDGTQRKLIAEDLVIADARRAVALAGIMGGLDSEISADTKNVLLESAWFNPVSVRRTSKRLGIHTEASHRFERGTDIEATTVCADRCIQMIQQLAGGEIDAAPVDVYPKPMQRRSILLHRWELSRHLGLEIPPEEVESILYHLGFHPRAKGRTGWTCVAPSYRVDVTREIDLVEEVARHYGYDRLPLRLPAAFSGPTHDTPHAQKEERVRSLILGLGYDETISNATVSRAAGAYGDAAPIALANPLSEEAGVLRTSLAPSLLDAVQWNLNRGQSSIRIFEIGKIYLADGDNFRELPIMGFAATGNLEERLTPRSGDAAGFETSAVEISFLDIKGDIEQVMDLFGDGGNRFTSEGLPRYYRPGLSARIERHGKTVAFFGEVQPLEAEHWKFRGPVFMAEVFLADLYGIPMRAPQAKQLSRYPAVERDFSVILPDNVAFEVVRKELSGLKIPELVGLRPVETFRGDTIQAGHHSLLLRVTLQSTEATLTEAVLSGWSARIIHALEKSLGATIRMSGQPGGA